MKSITRQELVALGKENANYYFSYEPSDKPTYFENYKSYEDSDGSYIDGDLINFCGGEIRKCTECYINFFDQDNKHIASYKFQPTIEEIIDMEAQSSQMLFD